MSDLYELVHRYHQAFNRRDVPYEQLFAPDFMLTINGAETPPGLGPKRGFDQMWWDAMDDLEVTSVAHVTAGTQVLCENRARGVHVRPLVLPDRVVAACGRRFDLRFAAAFELAAGKITRQRMYFDRVTLLEQLGALDAGPDLIGAVQAIYAAVPRGDLPFILAQCDDDVSWGIDSTVPASEVAPYGVRAGKAGVASFFEDWGRTVDFTAFEPSGFTRAGDHVHNYLRYTIRVKATGKTFTSPPLHQHWIFKQGKLVRFRGAEDSAGVRDAFRA